MSKYPLVNNVPAGYTGFCVSEHDLLPGYFKARLPINGNGYRDSFGDWWWDLDRNKKSIRTMLWSQSMRHLWEIFEADPVVSKIIMAEMLSTDD